MSKSDDDDDDEADLEELDGSRSNSSVFRDVKVSQCIVNARTHNSRAH